MAQPVDKWFSMRTDFFGYDSHILGLFRLSPSAIGLYVMSCAYAARWGLDHVHRTHAQMMMPRPSKAIAELVEQGFWVTSLRPNTWHIAHEGTLWRRGQPLQRRTIPVSVRAAVMKRDNYACVGCESTDELTIDHIWPYSKGGTDDPSNLRVLCRSCNSAKGARTDAVS